MAIFPEDYSRKVTPANGDFILLGDSEDNDKIKYGLYSDFKGEKGDSFNWLGEYNAGTTYAVNDAVSYGSKSYVCILASTGNLPTNTTYRGQIAAGILWRGTYAGGTAYAVNDAVYYSSKSYICKVASTGNLPTDTTYWDVLADLAPIDTSDRTYFVDQAYYNYTPAFLTGGTSAESSTVVWDSVSDGTFTISIDGVEYDITGLDFSAITDMDGVASVIQAGIRTATGSTETCVWSTDHFIISSVNTTTSSAITVTSAEGTGTDISGVGDAYMDCSVGEGTVTNKVIGGTSNENKVPILNSDGQLSSDFIDFNGGVGLENFTLGEDIASAGTVSLMADGKIYKQSNNKRLMSDGDITGHTSTTSCVLNGGTKIATLGLTTNTLTLYIGTIDDTNTITYGSGVEVATNCTDGVYMAKAGTDSIGITFKNTSGNIVGYAVSVSGTTPTVSASETVIVAAVARGAVYLDDGKIGVFLMAAARAFKFYVCSISGTTFTVGGNATIGTAYQDYSCGGAGFVDTNIAGAWNGPDANNQYFYLISVSGTTPTVGAGFQVGVSTSAAGGAFVSKDGAIYVVKYNNAGPVYTLAKCTYVGNAITEVYTTTIGYAATSLCMIGNTIGIVSSTSLKWRSDGGTAAIAKNTIDYGISLAQLYEDNSTDNYCIITVSGNPSKVYKIGNENRAILGYMNTTGSKAEEKPVYLNGSILTGLTDIIPGELYYITWSTGAIGLGGDTVFGKGLSTTSIKVEIEYEA